MAETMWTEDFLEKMSHMGDELADETVSLLFKKHDINKVNQLLVKLIRSDNFDDMQGIEKDVANKLKEYFEKSGKLPDWANSKMIKEGERVFEEYGMLAFALLGCASLPELYTCGRGGTQILGRTLQLEEHVTRRIFETTQMLINVMSQGGLDAEKAKKDPKRFGKGIRTIQKVRLMHAAVRHMVLYNPEPDQYYDSPESLSEVFHNYKWEKDDWGMPIGQEYLGCTLQTFSYVIVRGLRIFGVKLTSEEEEAYIHCWNVVGHIMGVRDEFLTNISTMEEAQVLFDKVMTRKQSRNDDEAHEGKLLTRAILDYMIESIKNNMFMGKILPLSHIPKILMLELMGTEKMALLGIKFSFIDRLVNIPVYLIMNLFGAFEKGLSKHHNLANWLFHKMAKELLSRLRIGDRSPFQIPDHLAKAWNFQP